MADEVKETVPEEQPPPVIPEAEEQGAGDLAPVEETETVAAPDAEPSKEGAGLKLAQPDEPAEPVDGATPESLIGTGSAEVMEPPDTTGEPAAPSTSTRKQLPRKFGLMTVNRCLAVAVLIIICLAGFEVWSNARTIQVPDAPPAILIPDADDSDFNIPSLEALLKSFEAKPILGNPDDIDKGEDPRDKTPRPKPPAGAIKYARENLDLIGMSDGEAIIVDKKADKMFFLRVGGEMEVMSQKLTLEQIGVGKVQFTDGKESVTVE